MAAQVTTSGLAKRFGGRLDTIVQKHAQDETEYGFQRLPAGIQNGVARVTKCYFDQYKSGTYKGEYYLRVEAVVVQPVMHRLPDGTEMKVAGLTTSVMRPMCETKTADGKVATEDENVATAMNELRMLGADTSTLKTGAQLEVVASAIAQTKPYTRFTTSQTTSSAIDPKTGNPYPPRTWENWHGSKGLESYSPPENISVDDDTKPSESTGSAALNGVATQHTEAPTETVEYTDQGDIDSLAELADNGDTDAQHKLIEMAKEAGVEKEAKAAENYVGVADLIKGSGGDVAVEEVVEEVVPEVKPDPAVKQMYNYTPPVKAPNGKVVAGKKSIKVEIVAVNRIRKTATVKNMVDGKTQYTNVAWDALE